MTWVTECFNPVSVYESLWCCGQILVLNPLLLLQFQWNISLPPFCPKTSAVCADLLGDFKQLLYITVDSLYFCGR